MSARDEWCASPMPAVIVKDAIGSRLAAEVRDRLERAGYTRYSLLDRGSYDFVKSPNESQLLAALTTLACEVTGRTLAIAEARALRLRPGDYVLVRHDRVHEERPVELVLDLSAASVPRADVHYRHRGEVYFTVPSRPGTLAVVERGPTVMCNHAYVSKRHVDAEIVRLVVLMTPARAPR